jgi:hypothetical protein
MSAPLVSLDTSQASADKAWRKSVRSCTF